MYDYNSYDINTAQNLWLLASNLSKTVPSSHAIYRMRSVNLVKNKRSFKRSHHLIECTSDLWITNYWSLLLVAITFHCLINHGRIFNFVWIGLANFINSTKSRYAIHINSRQHNENQFGFFIKMITLITLQLESRRGWLYGSVGRRLEYHNTKWLLNPQLKKLILRLPNETWQVTWFYRRSR